MLPAISKDFNSKLFNQIKSEIALLDPVSFAENHLTVDGKPFRMSGTGWKFMADLYREVAAQATNKNAKPMVILKGRQIGATVLAAVLSLYFTSSGLYGIGPDKPPMRVLHVFPTLGLMSKYAKDKLGPMVAGSQGGYINSRMLKNDASAVKVAGTEDAIAEKTFKGYNKLRIEGTGADGDRIRGLSQDVIFFDECFPYDQNIETDLGKEKIGRLYDMWANGEPLPLVKSYNESTCAFEFKQINGAWNRGIRKLMQITCGNREIRCTPNHRFLTQRGWVEASSLRIGDALMTSPGTDLRVRALNSDQLQIAIGSFLGDGHISSHKSGRFRLSVTHGIQQREYAEWKASMFNSSVAYIEKNGYAQKPAVRFSSKCFVLPGDIPRTKSTCPQWMLDAADARALAVWFMDDGSVNKGCACISTCSFDEDTQVRLVAMLSRFGINAEYRKYDSYFSLYLNSSNYSKLCDIIQPYVHHNMEYKLSFYRSCSADRYAWSSSSPSHAFTCVDKLQYDAGEDAVYDIGVADNHNFILCPSRTSKNVGGPIAHNCQDMSRDAIETAGPILTSAQYGRPTKGIQVYFGTPKGTGSHFYNLWQKSDQRFYQLRCTGCGHYFYLYTMGSDSWKKIWVSGHDVRCPECGTHQKKADAIEGGRWMPTKTGETQYVGYHVSVLLHPWFTKESILDLDPSVNRERSEKAWKNETLGEFYSGGGQTISLDDIRANCCDTTRGLAKSILDRGDKTIVMGIDWGGKDLGGGGDDDEEESGGKSDAGQSYTAVVIMSIDKNGIFTIENAYRLKRNDFEYKVNIISEMYRIFKVQVAAADIGYGQDIVQHMQGAMGFGERFLGCINSGTLNSTISYKPKELRVVLNKDAMIEEIFAMVRNSKIKFPVHGESYDRIEWLMQHFTSMEVKKVMKNDNVYNRYVKGAIQNDGLMAAIYGLIAYKFLATSGFKGSEAKAKGPGMPGPMLAYLPRV